MIQRSITKANWMGSNVKKKKQGVYIVLFSQAPGSLLKD